MLMLDNLGGGVPPPLTLIYRGLPPIKLLLFRAFLENLDFVTVISALNKVSQSPGKDALRSLSWGVKEEGVL
jgi:hypothetical protein